MVDGEVNEDDPQIGEPQYDEITYRPEVAGSVTGNGTTALLVTFNGVSKGLVPSL